MARTKSVAVSEIQSDPELFAELRAQINEIGPIFLCQLGLTNRTTLYEYTRGTPVTADSEQRIIDSIKKWKDMEKEAAKERKKQLKTVLHA